MLTSRQVILLAIAAQSLLVNAFIPNAALLRLHTASSQCNAKPSILLKSVQNCPTRHPTKSQLRMGLFDMFQPEITVAKLQVAAFCPNRSPSSLLGTIARLADEGDSEEINDLVSDIALALLRRESDWISGALETVKTNDEDKADEAFSQMSLVERAKIERETVNVIGGLDKSEERGAEGKLEDIGKSTVAVVTLIVALQGKPLPQVKDARSLKEALTTLASEALNPDSLLAGEVMWTPEEPYDTLLPEDVTLDFPTLIPL